MTLTNGVIPGVIRHPLNISSSPRKRRSDVSGSFKGPKVSVRRLPVIPRLDPMRRTGGNQCRSRNRLYTCCIMGSRLTKRAIFGGPDRYIRCKARKNRDSMTPIRATHRIVTCSQKEEQDTARMHPILNLPLAPGPKYTTGKLLI